MTVSRNKQDEIELDDELDELLAHGHEPAKWMRQTNRVVNAYISEVENLRIELRNFKHLFSSALQDMQDIKELQKEARLLLGAMEDDGK